MLSNFWRRLSYEMKTIWLFTSFGNHHPIPYHWLCHKSTCLQWSKNSVCACMSVDRIWTGAALGTSALSGNSEAEGVTGEFVICGVITESWTVSIEAGCGGVCWELRCTEVWCSEVWCGEVCLGGFLGRVTGAGVVGHFLGVPNLQESR